MKLYTKVTSERATKGQGGNKKLEIDILIDDRTKPRYRIFIDRHNDESTTISLQDTSRIFPHNMIWGETIKGKKQKDVNASDCPQCGSLQYVQDINYLGDGIYKCPQCK